MNRSGPLTPMGIFAKDAADWKKRALAAEAKLHGYRRLREIAEVAYKAYVDDGSANLDQADDAMDHLRAELASLDVVAPEYPGARFDVFDQVTKGLSSPLTIRRKANLGAVSTLDMQNGVIEIDAAQPDAAKLVGLVFQLVQLVDVAAMASGSEDALASPRWIQDRAPGLVALLLATRLIDPDVPVTIEDVVALVKSPK